jgi:pentatricopeptide repeat protein
MTDVYTLAIEHVYGDELQQILERDPPSCAILMKAYARLGDYDSAHEILFRLITYEKLTNNVIFNILVDIWAQSKSPHAFERAIQVINELENQGLKANRTTYHALLQIADCTSPNP